MNPLANQVALDARGLDGLKRSAHDSPEKALKAAATQFEALFMNMILKSMRESLPKDGLTSSSAGTTYTGMLDQQLSQQLAGRGTGLADMLVRQLSKNMKPVAVTAANPAAGPAAGAGAAPHAPIPRPAGAAAAAGTASAYLREGSFRPRPVAAPATTTPASVDATKVPAAGAQDRKRDFIARVAQHAKQAEQVTGVPARFMIGQAALESGWGKHEIRDGSGQTAFNLFGVKATGNWRGPTVDVTTTEFVDGVARKVVGTFRAYASYAESFADYARMLASNPRYASALKSARQGIADFAQGLQKAGYATDPAYAAKLTRVINDTVQIDRQA